MMLKYGRRLYSSKSLVKADVVSTDMSKVAVQGRNIYELQEYQSSALKEYFDQDALLIPVETIARKYHIRPPLHSTINREN
jgi:hypothetical protein